MNITNTSLGGGENLQMLCLLLLFNKIYIKFIPVETLIFILSEREWYSYKSPIYHKNFF